MNIPKMGEIWRHYKHDPSGPESNYTYEIIGIGFNAKSGESIVVYKPLYTHCPHLDSQNAQMYTRPVLDFLKEIGREDFDYKGPRFVRIK